MSKRIQFSKTGGAEVLEWVEEMMSVNKLSIKFW